MSQTLLVTGGCGFIGSNFVQLVMNERSDWRVINLDALTYAGNLENLKDLESNDRLEFVHGDITDRDCVDGVMARCDAVVHFAAESHVDRSIMDATPFVMTNVLGTQVLLDSALKAGGKRFVHVSTDEVYGQLPLDRPDLMFTEQTPLQPNSPYAASKTASDLFVRSYYHTHGLDAVITRCSNNFGPYQFPEKVIPLFVTNLIEGKKVPLYGDGLNVRDWIHVGDHCEGILTVLEKGRSGEVYNIGGNNEQSNLSLTHGILKAMGKGEEMIEYVEDRAGHDRRYAIDNTKIQTELGWKPSRSTWPGALEKTVEWYKANAQWWRRVRSGEYLEYYEKNYGRRVK